MALDLLHVDADIATIVIAAACLLVALGFVYLLDRV